MAQYEVFQLGTDRVVDVQTDLMSGLQTRVVVPLSPVDSYIVSRARLTPTLRFEGESWIMVTPLLSVVPEGVLSTPVGSVADHSDDITAALDMVFHGF